MSCPSRCGPGRAAGRRWQARERLERERAAAAEAGEEVIERIELGLDRDRFPGAPDGGVRRGCVKAGVRLEARREREALPIPRGRGERLLEARRRLDSSWPMSTLRTANTSITVRPRSIGRGAS